MADRWNAMMTHTNITAAPSWDGDEDLCPVCGASEDPDDEEKWMICCDHCNQWYHGGWYHPPPPLPRAPPPPPSRSRCVTAVARCAASS